MTVIVEQRVQMTLLNAMSANHLVKEKIKNLKCCDDRLSGNFIKFFSSEQMFSDVLKNTSRPTAGTGYGRKILKKNSRCSPE